MTVHDIGCDSCQWWSGDGGDAGECRRYAPRPRHTDTNIPTWPFTMEDDWCGEHEYSDRDDCDCDDCEWCDLCATDELTAATDSEFDAIVHRLTTFRRPRRLWWRGKR